ncbi:MAG TPA: MaoC family dehydratase [Blastocatellia bacterium]|nr:MaoC family dehydratase [Blastocatellia bacterium]
MTRIESITQLSQSVGTEVAVSDWIEMTQERIDLFAEATEDRQWIHVDPERAARESPFHRTIAHGFLTLSLLSRLAQQTMTVEGVKMAINYGLNRVRFVSPVPAGARIRGRFSLTNLEEISDGVQATWQVTVEREGGDKPCCVADWLVRYYTGSSRETR